MRYLNVSQVFTDMLVTYTCYINNGFYVEMGVEKPIYEEKLISLAIVKSKDDEIKQYTDNRLSSDSYITIYSCCKLLQINDYINYLQGYYKIISEKVRINADYAKYICEIDKKFNTNIF